MYFKFDVITRSQAKNLGYPRYYTGKPCVNGHTVLRYTASGKCWMCHQRDAEKYANSERGKHLRRKQRLRWHHANSEQSFAITRSWRERNYERYLERIYARVTKLKNATPLWYNELDEIAFIELKDKSAWLLENTGVFFEIDHIYPIRGKTVCGLHCKENWQLLPKSVNRAKFNHHPDDFWSY